MRTLKRNLPNVELLGGYHDGLLLIVPDFLPDYIRMPASNSHPTNSEPPNLANSDIKIVVYYKTERTNKNCTVYAAEAILNGINDVLC